MAIAMFAKFAGIEGESQDGVHLGEVDLKDWRWGLSQSGSMHTGTAGGKAAVQDLVLHKMVDKATPVLQLYCFNAERIDEVKLSVYKMGKEPVEYTTITMKKVLVSSINNGGENGQDGLLEEVTLNFAEVKFEYQPCKDGIADGGKVEVAWNIAKNEKA
jgi:type VI secretion system secreted protein Hcp